MLRGIAPVRGTAGDIHDAPATFARAEVRHGEATQVGSGLQIDLHRPLPSPVPNLLALTDRNRLVDAGVVDEHVDAAVEPIERLRPKAFAAFGCARSAPIWLSPSARVAWPITRAPAAVSCCTAAAPMPRDEPVRGCVRRRP
jgi:hypothetical protein